MNRKEIYQVIKGYNNDVATGLYLLEDLGYIESTKEKGNIYPIHINSFSSMISLPRGASS